jgi:hypothetical protein
VLLTVVDDVMLRAVLLLITAAARRPGSDFGGLDKTNPNPVWQSVEFNNGGRVRSTSTSIL